MTDFCDKHGIKYDRCGKVIVATSDDEIPRLKTLYERGVANGVPGVAMIDAARVREIEPHVRAVAGIHSPNTAIVDYGEVTTALGQELVARGVTIEYNFPVSAITRVRGGGVAVSTQHHTITARRIVNCAGLYSDVVARLAGAAAEVQIIPFRGEYYFLRPERERLVRGLIYPVPDPQFPFLGVHLTRMVDGTVHAGPNAVLALAREGYSWRRINPRDIADFAVYSGLWRLARRHLGYGLTEVRRSLSRRRFAQSLARLVPEVGEDDLVRTEAGVRAQAIAPDGSLVDDFLIVARERQVHVLNAPSPAATSSLEIAKHIVSHLPGFPAAA
jgi:L-2-hydroxyglutarate oxidase